MGMAFFVGVYQKYQVYPSIRKQPWNIGKQSEKIC